MSQDTLSALVDSEVATRRDGEISAPSDSVVNTVLNVIDSQYSSTSLGSLVSDVAGLADLYSNDPGIRSQFHQGGLAIGAIDSMGQAGLTNYLSNLQVYQGVDMSLLGRLTGISEKVPDAMSFGERIFWEGPGPGGFDASDARLLAHESVHALQSYGTGNLNSFVKDYYHKLNASVAAQNRNLRLGYKKSYYEKEAYDIQGNLEEVWP